MEELIENLKEQLQKVIKEHPIEINKDTYWKGIKNALETSINVAQEIKNRL